MAFFDKLREMKKEHDRKVEEERERNRLEKERREREERECEAMIMKNLESGELAREILHALKEFEWFSKSQGSWDSNCRQVIVTPITILINNHDSDTFFQYLRRVNLNGDKGITYILHREETVYFKRVGDSYFEYTRPTEETEYVDEILNRYKSNDSFWLKIHTFDGYAPIEDNRILERFATAIRNVLQDEFLHLNFSDVKKSDHGYYMFETKVIPTMAKAVY